MQSRIASAVQAAFSSSLILYLSFVACAESFVAHAAGVAATSKPARAVVSRIKPSIVRGRTTISDAYGHVHEPALAMVSANIGGGVKPLALLSEL